MYVIKISVIQNSIIVNNKFQIYTYVYYVIIIPFIFVIQQNINFVFQIIKELTSYFEWELLYLSDFPL